MKETAVWAAMLLMLGVPAALQAQSTIHLPSQGRQADFSGYPLTKPVRVVTTLPGSCASGEAVAISSGAGAGVYFCTAAGTWTPAPAHTHGLGDLSGVTGKQGTGSLLQAFGGGTTNAGDCVQFDAAGSIVSTNAPCGAGLSNYSTAFTGLTSVNLDHNLGTMNVLVGCYDGGEQTVQPNSLSVITANRVTVSFISPQTGRCVVNASGGAGGGGVATVFGRGGTVTAQTGDYLFSQLGGTLRATQIAGADVQGNGAKLQAFGGGTVSANDCVKFDASGNVISAGAPCSSGGGLVSSVFGRTGTVSAQSGDYVFGQIGGRAGLGQGGTNQAIWTAGRCVQVSADGMQLESASAACGSGGGGGQVAGAGLLGDGSSGNPFRVNPATVPTFLTAAASLSYATFADAGNCEEQNMPLPGAATGDAVSIGLPNSLPTGVILGAGYVAAADSVAIRLCRIGGTSTISSVTFRATVIKNF